MSELQRALDRARFPHLELVKLVGHGYFLKGQTEPMPAGEMLVYLVGLAEGAAAGRREVLAQMEGYQIALVAALDKLGGA